MTGYQTEHGTRNGLAGHGNTLRASTSDDLESVKDDVSEMGSAAAREARRLAEAARSQAEQFAARQKQGAANTIEDVARMLRQAISSMDDKVNIQRVVSHAAATLEDVSSAVRNKTFADLYDDAEDFARRRPVATALGTAAIGLMIARFIKSSSEKSAYSRGYNHARADWSNDNYGPVRPHRNR